MPVEPGGQVNLSFTKLEMSKQIVQLEILKDRIEERGISELLDVKTNKISSPQASFWTIIHPSIINVAKNRFDSGQRYDAVVAAIIALRDRIRTLIIENTGSDLYLKRGEKDLDGKELMYAAFKLPSPLIVFNSLKTESERNIQEGYTIIFVGVILAIRNPKAHDEIELENAEAVQLLGFFSYLFNQLDSSVKHADIAKRSVMLNFIRDLSWTKVNEKVNEWRKFALKYKEEFIYTILDLLSQREYVASKLDILAYIIHEGSENDSELIKLLEIVMDYTFTKGTLKSDSKVVTLKFMVNFMDLEPIKQILIKKYLSSLIAAFVNSESYNMAIATSSLLKYVTFALNEKEVILIINAFLQNDQIYVPSPPHIYLKDFLSSNLDKVSPEQQNQVRKLLGN